MSMDRFDFQSTFEYKLIYVFRINDAAHKGLVKIGDATVYTDKPYSQLTPFCHDLNQAAKARINDYTTTAGIGYELLWTEIAVYEDPQKGLQAFRDHKVHNVLKRSGVKNHYFDLGRKQNEWFECDLETAKKAITAVKANKTSLDNADITHNKSPIVFRPEQQEAIKKTLSQYKKGNRMLWNAKMRFGKTLTALQVAKQSDFSRTIIITHRPVVSEGWYDDFKKIFYDKPDYDFGSKAIGKTIDELERTGKKYVYFASMQDLRGSKDVGGDFDKNDIVFKTNWDFVVVDEAHEGTQTKLGQAVLKAIIKEEDEHVTKTLELSGTPFNLLTDYEDEQIYTWDYIMEQEAKAKWPIDHFCDSNPYEELPKLNIFTYHLEETFKGFMDLEDKAFNFREFFRVWTGDKEKDFEPIPLGASVGDFVHERDIRSFLDLICKKSDETNYPFSNETYRNFFRHTLWVLPGVKEAKAFSKLLQQHRVFSQFNIANVAGDGDEEVDSSDALALVRQMITENPDDSYSITLTCGRLTTGVTVPEWTAVLMLAGSYSTQASQYLQTIFRVQTPANINGRIKENCYVFDFAPDRTLKMVAESVQLSQRGFGSVSAEIRLGAFLNYCPVISIDDTGMKKYKVELLLQELKKAYAERVVRNGFDDVSLYNDELLKLDTVDLQEFERLKGIIGSTPAMAKTKQIDINDEGFTSEEYEAVVKLEKKKKKELTPEEKKQLEELKKKRKERFNAISILRGISIRIPLLVYGADIPVDRGISIEEFPNLVDAASWKEFMPNGITKEDFKKFSKYYDKDIFVASTFRIRQLALAADQYDPLERIKKITMIFSTFRNPDKETVLTPWRVVNLHMADTIGGYDFWNEDHTAEIETPRLVNNPGVTEKIFKDAQGKVLEINSKTGLYPLYVAYSFYKFKLENRDLSLEQKTKLWDQVLDENVFVICKTPMAKQITKRTLLGYRAGKINAHTFDDLLNQFKEKPTQFIKKVISCRFWNKEGKDMKFSAIVGNPPYTDVNGGAKGQSGQAMYQHFVTQSINMNPSFVSLIIPSRWMLGGGPELKNFRSAMIADTHLQLLFDHISATDIFSNVEIKGGVCYFLWNRSYDGPCSLTTFANGKSDNIVKFLKEGDIDFVIRNERLNSIYKKVAAKTNAWFSDIVSANDPFGFDKRQANSMRRVQPDYKLQKEDGDVEFYYFGWRTEGVGYISPAKISKGKELIDKWKVFIPKAWGNGILGKDKMGTCFVGKPGSCCTETYLVVGPFDTELEASNCCSFFSTKFFLTLVSLKKITQNCMQDCYSTVPLLDFKTIAKDVDLFNYYEFSDEEKNYIAAVFQE